MKDFVLTAWTIDPADFRLRLILGGSIGRDLRPAAHPRLVGQVLLPEGAFQVTLLALDHLALDQVHHQRQEEDDPQRVPQSGYPGIDHGQREVGRVAAVAERTCRGQPGNGPVGAYRCVGVAHSFAPPAPDQRPPTYEWPADDTHHAARQEGDVGSSVEYQPQEQWKEVDQRWRNLDARVIWLVVGHASSFARFLQHNILRYSPECLEVEFCELRLNRRSTKLAFIGTPLHEYVGGRSEAVPLVKPSDRPPAVQAHVRAVLDLCEQPHHEALSHAATAVVLANHDVLDVGR